MDIYLLHYNNYYNRILKRLETTQEYLEADAGYQKQALVSFNLNDGIMTSQVVNFDSESFDYAIVTENSTEDPETHISTPGALISRWFIMQANRNRTGQWTLQLQRDLVADHYDEITEAPMFVEKATIINESDVAIYNNENCAFNEIKQSEELLKDKLGARWLVGYYAPKLTEDIEIKMPTTNYQYKVYETLDDFEYKDYFDNNYYHRINQPIDYKLTFNVAGALHWAEVWPRRNTYEYHDGAGSNYKSNLAVNHTYTYARQKKATEAFLNFTKQKLSTLDAFVLNNFTNYGTDNSIEKVHDTYIYIKNENKLYHITVTKLAENTETLTFDKKSSAALDFNELFDGFSYTTNNTTYTHETRDIPAWLTGCDIGVKTIKYTLTKTEVTISGYNTKISQYVSGSAECNLSDAPYNMFAIPLDKIRVTDNGGQTYRSTLDSTVVKNLADQIIITGGIGDSGKIYDIQILPYCPLQHLIIEYNNNYYLNIQGLTAGTDFEYIKTGIELGEGTIVGYLFYPHNSKFSFNIDHSLVIKRREIIQNLLVQRTLTYNNISYELDTQHPGVFKGKIYTNDYSIKLSWANVDEITTTNPNVSNIRYITTDGSIVSFYFNCDILPSPETEWDVTGQIYKSTIITPNSLIVDKKIDIEASKYRLVSPNEAASFEFNLTKNGSIVHYFNVDCTYKPFTPYIHINPEFGGLYNKDFNDYRGLICAGDFSIPAVSPAWTTYQNNNKNYLNNFNREIDHIEIQNKYAYISDVMNVIGGTVTGGISGAENGAKAGPYGAMAGAVLGTAAGVGGGIADMTINEKLRQENISLQRDRFNFDLQNIRARPATLAKSTSFDNNNKYFPYLEFYSCTDQEKDIFAAKLNYEGMTIGRVDKLSSFLTNDISYVRGTLIRSTDIHCDDAQLRHIGRELKQGLYMKG